MAPQPPSKTKSPSARTLRHQRITGQIHPLLPAKIFRPSAQVDDTFLSTKRDKQRIKSSTFVSKITSARISKHERRRPSKKLKTNLDALADALPELDDDNDGAELRGKVRHKSLRSKRGALKRKERVVRGEMERFGVSMARLTGAGEEAVVTKKKPAGVQTEVDDDDDDEMETKGEEKIAPTPAPQTANRWAALRGYISATMEQNPAFAGKN